MDAFKQFLAKSFQSVKIAWGYILDWISPNKIFLLAVIVCTLTSFGLLLIATKSSPLYPINDWVDPHAFFTMGKGMMNDMVPYRDLFEQKGPLLYLIYGLAYLISNTNFLGVFILEVLFFTIFLFYGYKILTLYINHRYALITLPFIAAAVLNMRSFAHGGSAEQFSLTVITISLYYLIRYGKNIYPEPMPNRWVLINGLLAGCILWIKYSFLGFWFGWMATVFIGMLINKRTTRAIKACLVFLSGMLIATLPWVLYFGLHRSISDWLHTYFTINLAAYPQDLTWREITWLMRVSLQRHLGFNPFVIGLMVLGIIVFLTHRKFIKSFVNRIGLIFSIGCLVLGVYGGGRDFIYYFFILSPFVILGWIVLAHLYFDEYREIKPKLLFYIILLAAMIGTFSYTLQFNRNTYMLSWEKEDLVQYQFAGIINQTDHATLLNYGFPDGGFFTVAGILPTTRFFQSQNIEYSAFPLLVDEQNRYIKEGVTDYVVMRYPPTVEVDNLEIPHLYENYQLIETRLQPFGDIEFNYLLFRQILD